MPVEPSPQDAPPGRRAWLRFALLGLLLVVATVVALTVDRPGVPALRGWLDGAGPLGWAAVVLGVSGALMTPVPRTALKVSALATGLITAGLLVSLTTT